MTTHVELYEALKPHVGEAAAEMIAEVVPPSKDLATKTDIAEVRMEIAQLRAELKSDVGGVRAEMAQMEARLMQRMLVLIVPIYVMVGSMAIAIVGLVATKL